MSLTALMNAAPGVYVRTSTAGGAPVSLVFHDNAYILVEVPPQIPITKFPVRKPILLNNFADYQELLNQEVPLGAAERTCYNYMRMLFRNSGTAGQVYVIRVPGPQTRGLLYQYILSPRDSNNDIDPAQVVIYRQNVTDTIKLRAQGFPEITVDLSVDDLHPVLIGEKIKQAIEESPINTVAYVRRFDGGVERTEQTNLAATALPTAITSMTGPYPRVAVTATGNTVTVYKAIENPGPTTTYTLITWTGGTGDLYLAPRIYNQALSVYLSVGTLSSTPTLIPQVPSTSPILAENTSEIDYIEAINTSFNLETDLPGFLAAPAAFAHKPRDLRKVIGLAMEQFVSMPEVQWAAVIDCGPTTYGPVFTDTVPKWLLSGEFVTNPNATALPESELCLRFEQVYEELNSYVSTQGHSFVIAPYATDFEGFNVPGSAYFIGIALLAMTNGGGIAQPPAGVRYPIRGIRKLTAEYNRAQATIANNNHINLALTKPRWGPVVFGSRTRSFSPFYRFVNTRIILNTYIANLRRGFDEVLFRAPDGRGGVFEDILSIAENISMRFYQAGAFYGARPEDAYALQCDERNNPPEQIENGTVVLQCWVVPSPTLERLLIEVIRVPVGQMSSVLARVQQA